MELNRLIKKMTLHLLYKETGIKLLKDNILCGIYFLIDKNKVIYVGQSTDIRNRIKEHTDKVYNTILYLECREDELINQETFFIIALNPKYNKTYMYRILINKYRLEYGELSENEKDKIKYLSPLDACRFLKIIEPKYIDEVKFKKEQKRKSKEHMKKCEENLAKIYKELYKKASPDGG